MGFVLKIANLAELIPAMYSKSNYDKFICFYEIFLLFPHFCILIFYAACLNIDLLVVNFAIINILLPLMKSLDTLKHAKPKTFSI